MNSVKFSLTVLEGLESRLGSLAFGNGVAIDTPGCLLYTNGGSVPHLTFDNLQRVIDKPHPLLMSLQSTYDMRTSVESMPNGSLSRFCCYPDSYPVLLSVHDSLERIRTGFNDKNGVCIWRSSGKILLNAEHFSELVAVYRPAIYQALTDDDTPRESSKKRLDQSVKRSLDYLDGCLQQRTARSIDGQILASIQGGRSEISRDFSTKLTLERDCDIFGYVLSGFHMNGGETSDLNGKDFTPMVQTVAERLPREKARFMFGAFNPALVLQLVKIGVDCFDTSYACHSTDVGRALVFSLSELLADKCPQIFIDLKEETYRDDMSVIAGDCECYTCRMKFTRAYINHLMVTRELLGFVLLQLHNLHHWLKFFADLRQHMTKDKTL